MLQIESPSIRYKLLTQKLCLRHDAFQEQLQYEAISGKGESCKQLKVLEHMSESSMTDLFHVQLHYKLLRHHN